MMDRVLRRLLGNPCPICDVRKWDLNRHVMTAHNPFVLASAATPPTASTT